MKPIHQTITFFIISAILISAVGKTLLFGDFLMNQDLISKTICEKRFEKINHCNGKCHLKKVLQQEEQRENSSGQYEGHSEIISVCHSSQNTIFYFFFIDKIETFVLKKIANGYVSIELNPPN